MKRQIKADAIRAELKKTKSPAAVVAELQKQGICVTPEDVWQIREDYLQSRLRRLNTIKFHTDLIRLAVDLVLASEPKSAAANHRGDRDGGAEEAHPP